MAGGLHPGLTPPEMIIQADQGAAPRAEPAGVNVRNYRDPFGVAGRGTTAAYGTMGVRRGA